MSSATEKLIDKIRKLRAKANDPSTTEAEAAAFAAKVQELLTQHGLSMENVREKPVEDDLGSQTMASKWKSPARQRLLRDVCSFYMCIAVGPGRGEVHWTIVGRPHNVLVALEMTDYLISTVVRISNQYGRANSGANVIDFRRGCMMRLAERLRELTEQQKAAKQERSAAGNAANLPALFVDESRAARQYMETKMRTTMSKSRSIKQGSDAMFGRAAAEGISLQPQVGQRAGGGRLAIGSK